jgi:hypothetical protein
MLKKIIGFRNDQYQCCFCGEPVDKKSLVLINLDLGDKQYQSMAAHGKCMENSLHPSVPFIAPEDL